MTKITLELLLKIAEAASKIIVVIMDTVKRRNKDDSTGSTKKE